MLIPVEPKIVELPALVTVPRTLEPIVEAIKNGSSLVEPITRIARSMGFTTFVYGVGTGRNLRGDERYFVWSTAPREWVAEYDQNSYVEIDPRVTHAWTVLPPPLIWDASMGDSDPKVAAFLDRAAKYGIGSGVALYLHDYSTKVLVGLSQPQRRLSARRRAQISAKMGDAMALASIFHLIFMREVVAKGLSPLHQGSPLSPRERQCLQLAAHGMTSIDIGEKLGITERTANFHFSNIISKLGVLNRNEAIAKATAHGLIQVDTSATPIVAAHSSKIREAQIRRWEALHNPRGEG
jgi:LuxR family quorum-sensing transcriptional regulator LasR